VVASIAAASKAALIAPALPIASVPTGNAGRHLDDRQQAIHALQRLAFDRHAEHRQRGHRRRHAGQMRRAAGAGDDQLEPALRRRMGIIVEPLGRAVGRDDPRFMGDAERSSVSAAWRIVSQSDVLPMMIPTSGSAIRPCSRRGSGGPKAARRWRNPGQAD
jgi:hypothetical protein